MDLVYRRDKGKDWDKDRYWRRKRQTGRQGRYGTRGKNVRDQQRRVGRAEADQGSERQPWLGHHTCHCQEQASRWSLGGARRVGFNMS